MLSYEKRAVQWKKRTIVILSLFLLIAVGVLTYLMRQNAASEPTVAQHEETILPLPDTPKKEKIQKPFQVEASAVVDYFDGEESEVDKFTKFEDVYRSSQGIDYSCNDEQFEIVAMLSGEISDVREDELFGQTVVLKKDNITITMQSLDNVKVKKGDSVSQGDVIATAGSCVFSKDLGNHLHLVTEVNGKLTDPKLLYDKSVDELDTAETKE